MSTYKWRPQEERLVQALLPTNSYREIAEQINRRHDKNIAGFPCERTDEAVRKKCDRESWTPESCSSFPTEDPHKQRWDQLYKIQKEYASLSTQRTRGVLDISSITTKILVLSDIHFPFARVDLLKAILAEHEDADIVVVNGDLMEGHVFSTFEKNRSIAALDEYHAAFNFVRTLSETFPKVILVDGNHDIRASRALSTGGFSKDATQVLRPNLMARIANGEVLDETGLLIEKLDFKNVLYEQRESWFVKVGKTLFIHPHGRGGGAPGATVTSVGDKLMRRYPEDDVDSVVCGHTHKIYKGVLNGKLYIEQGFLAGVLAYLHSPKNDYRFNYQNGYAVIYQDSEGNTDFNLSGPIYMGESLPPKKDAL
jgi:predicted phosphodiesterase